MVANVERDGDLDGGYHGELNGACALNGLMM